MNREKVKEIKKALEQNIYTTSGFEYLPYEYEHSQNLVAYTDILKLINELEIELEKEQINNLNCDTELQYKEKRIAELEKENARLLNSVETVQNNRCTTKCELTKKQLKQFAERLKEEGFVIFMGNIIIRESKVDEIVKEFINKGDDKENG